MGLIKEEITQNLVKLSLQPMISPSILEKVEIIYLFKRELTEKEKDGTLQRVMTRGKIIRTIMKEETVVIGTIIGTNMTLVDLMKEEKGISNLYFLLRSKVNFLLDFRSSSRSLIGVVVGHQCTEFLPHNRHCHFLSLVLARLIDIQVETTVRILFFF